MANLIINDLVESRELDRQAMATLFGGFARGALFSFPLVGQTSFPGTINVFNLTQLSVTQVFVAETIQLIKQDLTIINSDNVIAATIANTQNIAPEIIAGAPTPSLPF